MTRGKHEQKRYREDKVEQVERKAKSTDHDDEPLDDASLEGASGGRLINDGRKKPF